LAEAAKSVRRPSVVAVGASPAHVYPLTMRHFRGYTT